MRLNPDCYYGDHTWRGGSICVHCYERLRCSCGRFVRADGMDEHLKRSCPIAWDELYEVQKDIESSWSLV